MKKYSFKVQKLYGNLTAEEAAKELERIENIYGELLPEHIVDESRNPESILHHVFNWDDTAAAEAFRKIQAQRLMNNITVEIVHKKVKVNMKAFLNVRKVEYAPRTYVPIEKVLTNDVAYKDLFEQAEQEMESFIQKYSNITELESVRNEMKKILDSTK